MPGPLELLKPQYDHLFKTIVAAGWADDGNGHVEAPTGYFALVTIEENEIAELTDAINWREAPEVPVGYFTTIEDSDGVIVVYRWATKHQAKAEFKRHESEYGRWANNDGED